MNIKKYSHKILAASILSAAVLFAASQPTHAAGFYIQEQSVKGLGTAFAGSTTSIDDASTLYFNPAGMTKLEGAQANAGLHLLIPNGDLDDTGTVVPPGQPVGGTSGNPYSLSPVPNLYGVMPLTDKVWGGIGVSAPFGLGNEYKDGWFGRYDSTESELKTINISPAVAFEATDWLSVGIGADLQYAEADLKSAIFVGAGAEGVSQLEGDDWSLGYNIGLQATPDFLPNTEFGIHYRSAMSHTLDGEINISGTGTPADSSRDGTADLNLPDIATFGVAHDITPKTRVMGQATWFGWNNFQDIDADTDIGADPAPVVQNYQTTWAFSVGAEHDLNDQWTVRAGYQYDETPTTDEFRTSRTPDGDRNWFSGGATYELNDKIDLDFAATYIVVGEETINVTRNTQVNPALASTVSADTSGSVGIVAFGLNYKF
jgi:long-chain fatty acid transport protein